MLPFAAKLLFARQLNFEKGKLTIFGQRVTIIPASLLLLLNKRCTEDKQFARVIYQAMKDSVYEFCQAVSKRFGIKREEMAQFLMKLTEMNGYGILSVPKLDYRAKVAVFHVYGLPSEALAGQLKAGVVVDHYWAGMLAGGVAFAFDDFNINVLETSCVANRKGYCRFVAALPAVLRRLRAKTT